MPRPPRLEYPGAFYHVYSRGNRKEKIFHSPDDYRMFEAFLADFAGRCRVVIYAWCLMPNHFHFLLETPEGNLSHFMRRLLTRYASCFNRRYKLVGHVFESRYKAILCDKERYFLELIRYIHLNPLRKEPPLVEKLTEWRWSSHRFYATGTGPEHIRNMAKSLFGGTDTSPQTYLKFLADERVKADFPERFSASGFPVLGDDRFLEEIEKKAGTPVLVANASFKSLKSCLELRDEVCRVFGVKPGELEGPGRQARLNMIRQAMALVGRFHYRFPTKELGRCLGRNGGAVSQIVRRQEARAAGLKEMIQLIGELKAK